MRLRRVARTAVVLLAGFVGVARAGSPPTVYVNNLAGSDKFDGSRETVSGDAGPVATLARGTSLLKPSGRLVIQNTGKPYRGEVKLIDLGGTADQPLIVDGNGAVIEGIGLTKPSDWKDEGNGIISTDWRPDWGFLSSSMARPVGRALWTKFSRGRVTETTPRTGATFGCRRERI